MTSEMKSPGQILKESRIRKGYTLDQVEKSTKIRLRYLQALENDDYSALPSTSYAKGFIKNYSDFLGLNTTNLMAFFRRQTKDMSRSQLLPSKPADYLENTLIQLTPKKFLILTIFVLAVIFGIYFGTQYRNLQLPPKLVILAPQNNFKTTDSKIEIIGQTAPDATVTINGISILVRDDGKFFDKISLSEGDNLIKAVATSRYGKSQAVEVKVSQIKPF